MENLPRAEVVLVGASRTMKPPAMLYPPIRAWFAANAHLIPGIPVPDALQSVPGLRVFCLPPEPKRLLEPRHPRAIYLDLAGEGCAAAAALRSNLNHTQQLAPEFAWPMIDAAGKSLEDVAREPAVTSRARVARGGP